MTRALIVILSLLFFQDCLAQQASQFTQFTLARPFYNPGAVGEDDVFSVTGRHRNQWSGLEGGPNSQNLILEFPRAYNSLGFGVVLSRAAIGIQEVNDVSGIYAYKLRTGNSLLSLGLQFSYRQFINDFTKEGLIAIDGFELDPSLEQKKFNVNLWNVGFGLYLSGKNYHAGIAIPRMVRSDIGIPVIETGSTEVRQLYGMLGAKIRLGEEWEARPDLLLKYAEIAPYDVEFQGNFIYRDQLRLGLNARAGGTQSTLLESVGVLIGFNFTNRIFASMSYDFNTTELRQYEDGSFELVLRYRAFKDRSPQNIQNPRYY